MQIYLILWHVALKSPYVLKMSKIHTRWPGICGMSSPD